MTNQKIPPEGSSAVLLFIFLLIKKLASNCSILFYASLSKTITRGSSRKKNEKALEFAAGTGGRRRRGACSRFGTHCFLLMTHRGPYTSLLSGTLLNVYLAMYYFYCRGNLHNYPEFAFFQI